MAQPEAPTLPPVLLRQRREVFRNSKFHVWAQHISQGATEVPDYLVIEARVMREDDVTGVSVLPEWQGQLMFLSVYRHVVGRTMLEAPGGFLEIGEDPATAALRELREETGLVCAPERLVPLGFCRIDAGLTRARVALFGALDCQRQPRQAIAGKIWAWWSRA